MSLKGRVISAGRLFHSRFAVRENVTYGSDFHVGIGSLVWAPRHLEIGNRVYVGRHVTIQVDGVIGDHVLIANNVGVIGRTDHATREVGKSLRESTWVGDDPDLLSRRTVVGSDVWLGFGSIVLSGVTIGDSSIVAAGSVVTNDIPPNSIAAGIPARVVGQRFTEQEFSDHWVGLESVGVRRMR